MPGPIAHAAMGYLIYRAFRPHMPAEAQQKVGPASALLAGAVSLSLAPDLDAVPSVLFNDFARFHNNLTHSFVAGLAVAAGTGLVSWAARRPEAARWALLALVCYQAHLIMDLLTYETRGLLLLWPFSDERFQGPVSLFYGFRWSQGLVSPKHLITLITEAGFAVLTVLMVKFVERFRRGQRTGGSAADTR